MGLKSTESAMNEIFAKDLQIFPQNVWSAVTEVFATW